MDFITLLGSAWPEGNFWATLIKLFDVGSYAWTIILFTIVLKLILSPIDFLQRFYTNKTTRAQAKLQPELEKLKKRYGQNQTLLYQKQNELYQKNNIKMGGSCVVMIVYMAVTLTVFLTLWSSLQAIAGFKIKNQFFTLQETYQTVYEPKFENEYLQNYLGVDLEEYSSKETQEQKDQLVLDFFNAKVEELVLIDESDKSEEEKRADANKLVNEELNKIKSSAQIVVVNKYLEIKDSFIWIKNIWRPDKATVKEIASYNEFKASTGYDGISEAQYNEVMGKLLENYNDSNQTNGYYILSIIVVIVSLLSQLVIRWVSKPKNANGQVAASPAQPMSKILMFIMPITMLLFTISSSAIFAIYIITNSIMTTALTPLTTIICNKIEDNKEKKHKEEIKVDYRR